MALSDYGVPGGSAARSATIVMPDHRIALVVKDLQGLPYLGEQVLSSCPNDDGSYYEIRLSYSSGASHAIVIRKTGCNDVFIDGKWSRRAPESWSSLIADLHRILANNPR
jgi:hypothetical protein